MDTGSAMSLDARPLGETGVTSVGARSAARESRMQDFGIDCGDGLTWGGGTWEPGGEYVQRLRVKNVSTKMQRVKWRLPESKFFSMDFPDPVRLAPGNSVLLEVRFRPVRREEYEDGISFTVDGGTFVVPVRARLSRLATEVTSAIRFGLVPVNEPTGVVFSLDNTGQVPARFRWSCPRPFVVEPSAGVVEPGASARLVCTVLAASAAIVHAVAVVDVDGVGDDVAGSGSERHSVELDATSKYQHIVVRPSAVDLGDVMVGAGPVTRTVLVENPGPVRATVSVRPAESDRRPHFTLTPQRVLVDGGGGTAELTLRYTPRVNGSFSCERFQITTPGGSAATLEAKACARGPRVTLSRKDPAGKPAGSAPLTSFGFGDVPVGSRRSQVCRLRNASDAPASFSFLAEAGGVFSLGQTQGTVPARLFLDVTVTFAPRCPGNFYRRVYVLVRDSEPLLVDLLGSGMDEATRPFPIRQRHVDAYRLRPAELLLCSPDTVKEVSRLHREAEAAGLDPEEVLPARHGLPALTSRRTRAMEAELAPARADPSTRASLAPGEERTRAGAALLEELVRAEHEAGERPFVLSQRTLQMGAAPAGALPPKRTVSLTNRTEGKVTVQWHVPVSALAASPADPSAPRDFAVTPPVLDIDAGATADFSVAFRPHQASAWYAQELEAVVFPKQNRTFRLVDEESFTPPETVVLRAMGHSFDGAGAFLPRFSTSLGPGVPGPLRLDMPACPHGSVVHVVFELRNEGEVPAAFEVSPPDPTGAIAVVPDVGLVPVGAFVLLLVRFSPTRDGDHAHSFQLLLNGDAAASPRLDVRGVCSAPRLALPDGGAVFAPPTAVGATSSVLVPLASGSRVPAAFHVRVPHASRGTVQVAPACGVVRGNETQSVRVTFCPGRTGHQSVRLECDVFGGGALAFAALGPPADRLNMALPMRSFEERDLMSATSKAVATPAVAAAAAALGPTRAGLTPPPRSGSRLPGTQRLLDEDDEDDEEGLDLGSGASPREHELALPGDGGQETKEGDGAAGPGRGRAGAEGKTAEDGEDGDGASGVIVELSPAPPADPSAVWPWDDTSAVSRLGATVVSEGTRGALAFGPAAADLGPGVVGEGLHRAVALVNRSGCTLRWRLHALVEVVPQAADASSQPHLLNDDDADADADEEAARREERAAAAREGGGSRMASRGSRTIGSARSGFTSGTGGLPAQQALDGASDAGSGFGAGELPSSGDGSRLAEVRFEPSSGTLPARSRTQVDVSVLPHAAGRVAVRVFYSLESVDAAGVVTRHGAEAGGAAEDAHAAALQVRRAAERETARTGVAVVPPPPPMNRDDRWLDLRAEAGYPALAVEDARSLRSREALLWLFPTPSGAAGPGAEALFRGGAAAAAIASGTPAAGVSSPSLAPASRPGNALDALLADAASTAAMMGGPGHGLRRQSSDRAVVTARSSSSAAHGHAGAGALALSVPEPEPRVAGDAVGGWQFRLPGPTALPWQGPLSAATAAAFQHWAEGDPSPSVPRGDAPSRLWERCSLRALNRLLARKLSPDEIAHAEAGPLHRDPAELPTATVEFEPAPVGAPPEVLLWQVRNVGGLPAQLDVAFPSDSEIETEQWAEPTEPSRAEVRTRQLIDRRVFDIRPRRLSIAPGECATLRLHYAHVTTALADGPGGTHQVEVLLKAARGRTVRLRLRGRTLRPHVPLLWLGSPAASRRLDAVPLGVTAAPVQSVRVVNPTDAPVRFVVDQAPLAAAAAAAHGFAVWECLTPDGELAPGAEADVLVRFTPLEDRDYALPLRLRFGPARGSAPVVLAAAAVRDEAETTSAEAERVAESVGAVMPERQRRADDDDDGGDRTGRDGGGMPPLLDEIVAGTVRAVEEAERAVEAVMSATAADAVAQQAVRRLVADRTRRRRAMGASGRDGVTPESLRALPTEVSVVLRARGYTPLAVSDADEDGSAGRVDAAPPLVRPGVMPVGPTGAAAEVAAISAQGTSARSAMRSDGLEAEEEEEAAERGDETGSSAAAGDPDVYGMPSAHGWSVESVDAPSAGGGHDAASLLEAQASTAAVVEAPGSAVLAAATPAAHMRRIRAILDRLRLGGGEAADGKEAEGEEAEEEEGVAAAAMSGRRPRPGAAPPAFHCAHPPLRRHLASPAPWLAESMAAAVPEWLRFGDVPAGSGAHRVVVLRNDRGAAAAEGGRGRARTGSVASGSGAAGRVALAIGKSAGFGGGGGALVFEWDCSHPLLADGGPLRVHPRKGRLEPGETAVCRVTLTAGAVPRVLWGDLPVVVAVPEEEMVARCGRARRRAAAQALHEQQQASRKPPEPGHVPVALKSTSARNNRIQARAVEKHLKAAVLEKASEGDVGLQDKARAAGRARKGRGRRGGEDGEDEDGGEGGGGGLGGRRAGAGLTEPHPAAVALGAGRKGLRPDDVRPAGAAAGLAEATFGAAPQPLDPAEARVAGVVAAVRDALTAAEAGQDGSADDQDAAAKSVARSVASSRSRLSASRSNAVVDAAAAAVPTPVPPASRLFVHVTARVCGEDEFRQAHGSRRFASFLRSQAAGADAAGLPAIAGQEEEAGAASRRRAGGAVEADVGAAPEAVAGAGGGTEGRAVLEGVLGGLLADVVADADVSGAAGAGGGGGIPTFRELAARRGRDVHGHAAAPVPEKADGASAARVAALRSAEVRRLCSKYLHTTVVNLARDMAAGVLDLDAVSAPLVSLEGERHE